MVDKPRQEPEVLLIGELADLFQTSERNIRRKLAAGTFPIPPLTGIDKKIRFSRVKALRYAEGKK